MKTRMSCPKRREAVRIIVEHRISDRISIMFTEQGFSYSNWLFIRDDTKAVVEAGLDAEGLQGVDSQGVKLILNSHYHMDHTRGNEVFPNAQVAIHESEADTLTDSAEFYRRNSLDEWKALMPHVDLFNEITLAHFPEYAMGSDSSLNNGRPVINLADGQRIDFGHTYAQVLFTPGHTGGHCSFFFPEEDFLFCGDICLTRAGPWYGEHLADPAAMMESIDRIISLHPKRLVSAHIHELVENPTERLREFKNRIPMRDEKVFSALRQHPCTLHQLAAQNIIYRRHPSPFEEFWEKLMLNKHLARLIADGLVVRDGEMFCPR